MESSKILSNHLHKTNKTKLFQKNQISLNQNTNENESGETNTNTQVTPTLSFAQLEMQCYYCGKTGLKSPQCKYCNSIPKSEWAITKTKAHFVHEKDNSIITTKDSSISTKNKNNKKVGWAYMHFSFFQSNEMRDVVLLDSDSTNTMFGNKNYVSNIRKSQSPLILKTNEITTNCVCDVSYLSNQWYNKKVITNIISLTDITKQFRVTMDTQNEKSFTFHQPDKIMKFSQM